MSTFEMMLGAAILEWIVFANLKIIVNCTEFVFTASKDMSNDGNRYKICWSSYSCSAERNLKTNRLLRLSSRITLLNQLQPDYYQSISACSERAQQPAGRSVFFGAYLQLRSWWNAGVLDGHTSANDFFSVYRLLTDFLPQITINQLAYTLNKNSEHH